MNPKDRPEAEKEVRQLGRPNSVPPPSARPAGKGPWERNPNPETEGRGRRGGFQESYIPQGLRERHESQEHESQERRQAQLPPPKQALPK